MKLTILSEQKSFIKKPRSSDCIIGQENAFLKNENVDVVYKSKLIKNINRVITRVGITPIYEKFIKKEKHDCVYLYIAMNLNYLESNSYLLKELKKHNNKLALYIYDCWEPEFDGWEEVINDINPDYIFFCFKQTWEHYKDRLNCYWVPQSADLNYFKPLNSDKTRLFMQMGRVNDDLHNKILEYLSTNKIQNIPENYIYRKDKNTNLFPDLNDLVREINKTKYFVCVPKCYENFKRTGNVRGITARYFEAIACKTLIIGKKPYTFDELFSSDGMIEFLDDLSDFDTKISDIQNNPDKYNQILENNYKTLIEKNTWHNRCNQILDIINRE